MSHLGMGDEYYLREQLDIIEMGRCVEPNLKAILADLNFANIATRWVRLDGE